MAFLGSKRHNSIRFSLLSRHVHQLLPEIFFLALSFSSPLSASFPTLSETQTRDAVLISAGGGAFRPGATAEWP